jgi:hypothetical protein
MKKIKIVLIINTIFLFLGACAKSGTAGDKSSLYAFAATTLQKGSLARKKCITSVGIMNQCVGAGNQTQFNPDNMCSDANLKTEAEYDSLISCTSGIVNSTYCNFSQNKVATAAKALGNFFSSCNEPEGIIVAEWYTITLPDL